MLEDVGGAIYDLFAQAEAEAEDVDAIIDSVGNLTLDDVYDAGVDAWNLFAQTDTQRRRRGRGGGRKKRGGGWGKAAKNVAKDAAKSIGTSMAEDAAWCAVGDPLNVVGCNSGGDEEEKPAESKSWWSSFAQTEADAEQLDMLEDVGGALWDLFAQTEAGTEQWDMLEDVGGAIYDLFAQVEEE